MSENNNNGCRLEINPLIEENMNQMEDSEFSISQLTGHITLKREDEYISKTKELKESSIDLDNFYNNDKTDFNINLKDTSSIKKSIEDFEKKFNDNKTLLNEIETLIENNKEIINSTDEMLNNIDESINRDYIYSLTETLDSNIENSINKLGDLLIQNELLKVPLNGLDEILSFIDDNFSYLDIDSDGNEVIKSFKYKNKPISELINEYESKINGLANSDDYEKYSNIVINKIINVIKSIPHDKKEIKGNFDINCIGFNSFKTGTIKNY